MFWNSEIGLRNDGGLLKLVRRNLPRGGNELRRLSRAIRVSRKDREGWWDRGEGQMESRRVERGGKGGKVRRLGRERDRDR